MSKKLSLQVEDNELIGLSLSKKPYSLDELKEFLEKTKPSDRSKKA